MHYVDMEAGAYDEGNAPTEAEKRDLPASPEGGIIEKHTAHYICTHSVQSLEDNQDGYNFPNWCPVCGSIILCITTTSTFQWSAEQSNAKGPACGLENESTSESEG